MSQNEFLNPEIIPIEAPELTSSQYGSDISGKFKNINDNFAKLSNIDLYKGEDGNSLIIEEVSLSKDEEKSDEVSYKLYAALADTFTNKFSGSINSSPNGKKWDEYIETYKIPLVKRTNRMDENDDVYLGSIMPILFFDGRFSSESIVENNRDFSVYNGIDDCTCIVQFTCENGSWKCIINESFPKLSYRNGNFYWVIGGVESTAIRATGVKGERGTGAHIWMCNGVSGNESEIIVSSYITSEEGSVVEKPFNNNGETIEGSDAKYYGVEGDPVFVFDYDQRVSDDESGETYYKDYKGIVIAHLQKYNAEKQQWIARVDGDIKHVNFVKNTVEFFKTLGENNEGGVKPAQGMFLRFNPDDKNNQQCHAIYNKSVGKFNNIIISPQDDCDTEWNPKVKDNTNLQIYYPTQIEGTLAVGDTAISGLLGVSGCAMFELGFESGAATIHDKLTVAGNTELKGELVTGDTTINGDLDVTGSTELEGNLHVEQTVKIDDKLNVNGSTELEGELVVSDNVFINGGLNVTGSIELEGDLHVEQTVKIDDELTVDNTTNLNGNVTIKGATEIQNQLKINLSGGAANTGDNKNSIFIYNTGIRDGEESINTDTQRIGDYYAIRIGAESTGTQNLYINRTGLQAATWDEGKNFAPRPLCLNYRGGTVQIGSKESATEDPIANSLTVYSVVGENGAVGENGTVGGAGEAGGKGGTCLFINGGTGGTGGTGGKGELDKLCGTGGAGGKGGTGIIVYGGKGGRGGSAGAAGYSSKDGTGGTGGTGIIVYGGEGGMSPNSIYGSRGNAIEAYGDVIIEGDVSASSIFAASPVLFLNNTDDWTNGGIKYVDGISGQFVIPKKPAYMLRLKPADDSNYIVGIPADIYPPNCIVMIDFYNNIYYLHDKDNLDGFNNAFRMFVFGTETFDVNVSGTSYKLRKPIGWINCGFSWSEN